MSVAKWPKAGMQTCTDEKNIAVDNKNQVVVVGDQSIKTAGVEPLKPRPLPLLLQRH